jgi:cellobiose-specific phosphotransferase system component IIC
MNNPFEGLDVNTIKNAGLPTKLMLGGSVAFFIFAFFDWWSVSSGPYSVSGNAFDNFRGTFAWIMMIAVGVLAVLLLLKGSNRNLVIAALACSGLSALFTLWFWAAIPDSGIAEIETSASFGLFLALIAAIVSTVGAFMTFQSSQ